MARVKALELAALPTERFALVTVDDQDVALFRRGDEVLAIGNLCPHQGGSLCDGFVEGDIVTCPLHGWEFDLITGKGLYDATSRVATYAVEIDKNGDLIVIL